MRHVVFQEDTLESDLPSQAAASSTTAVALPVTMLPHKMVLIRNMEHDFFQHQEAKT